MRDLRMIHQIIIGNNWLVSSRLIIDIDNEIFKIVSRDDGVARRVRKTKTALPGY